MILSIMAVYTKISAGELQDFVAGYNIGTILSYEGIAEGVENTNYLIKTNKNIFILTLFEKRVIPNDMPFFLELMEFLSKAGIPCPTPLRGRDGNALRSLCGKPAAIVSFLKGKWPRCIKENHCYKVGNALARLHNTASNFYVSRQNALALHSWRPLLERSATRADEVVPGLTAILTEELNFLEQNWPSNLPKGICHADLFPDNVFFLGNKIAGLIDFYFACNDYFIYDLAICLNAWCFENDTRFSKKKAHGLLAGYQNERTLSSSEITALPTVIRGAALRFLLTRLYDWLNHSDGAFVKPKDPKEYLNILRFHQSVLTTKEYGID